MENSLQIPGSPRVLVVGSGAREHAIAWKLARSEHRPTLFAAPGNPGMAEHCTCVNLAVDDIEGITSFAVEQGIHLVVVGPELPLSLGLVDACINRGILAFGPSQAAAQLEASKAFAKDLMREAAVPTATYAVFDDAEAAKGYIAHHGAPVVVKADGLAAGKGVVVAKTVADAQAAVDDMLVGGRFGSSGSRVVIESFLAGDEVSLMYFVDGDTAVPMVPARDHKRVGDGDTGPNTGGMGAFAPVPSVDAASMTAQVTHRIVRPTLTALKSRGIVYSGVLYVGLMMTKDGPYVVEFNARFGDPETEVVLPLLSTDLVEVLWATASGRLSDLSVTWHDAAAVCVVLAAPGYPERPQTGGAIELNTVNGSQSADSAAKSPGHARVLFHAGTKQQGDELVTAGGRVLVATGVASSVDEARRVAYDVGRAVYFDGIHYRRDIATRL